MGWLCGCFDGLRARRSADADPALQKQPKQGIAAPVATTTAVETPVKPERSPARKAGSEVTEEPLFSARSEGFSSQFGGTTREPTEEQDFPSSRIGWKTPRRSGMVDDQVRLGPRSSRSARKSLAPRALAGPFLPAAVAGTWRYHETATYQLTRLPDDQWRFDEIQDSGRTVAGIMQPHGSWMKGVLCFTDTQEECGTIRMAFSVDEGVIRSNFRPSGEDWWSGDMVAIQEESGKRRSTSPQVADEAPEIDKERSRSSSVRGRRSVARDRASSSRTSLRSSEQSRSSSRGRTDRQVLELIPTRVRAKLERSIKQTRKRTPSLTRVKMDRDSGIRSIDADPEDDAGRSTLRTSGLSSRFSAESTESSTIIKEVHVANMKPGFGPAAGEAGGPAGGQERKPCCSTLFQVCCRNETIVDPPAGEYSELYVERHAS